MPKKVSGVKKAGAVKPKGVQKGGKRKVCAEESKEDSVPGHGIQIQVAKIEFGASSLTARKLHKMSA